MAVALKVKVDFLLLSIDDFICKQKNTQTMQCLFYKIDQSTWMLY